MRGQGFAGHGFESLHSLMTGAVAEIHPVDAGPAISKQGIIDALREIMIKDLPDIVRTQGSDNHADGDHADHHDVGVLTEEAAAGYLQAHMLIKYMGYPSKELSVNLSDDDITGKQAAFFAYANHDGAVCQTVFECQQTVTYGNYLTRQYVTRATPQGQ
jgi:LmbE family N-acetylglucosaminyl deacetylase